MTRVPNTTHPREKSDSRVPARGRKRGTLPLGGSASSRSPARAGAPESARARTSTLDPQRCAAILGTLQEISTASTDVDGCGHLLELVSDELRAEQAALILCNPLTSGLEFVVHNQDPSFPKMYADYFCDLDPTHIADYLRGRSVLSPPSPTPIVFDLREVVDYGSLVSTEFYTDFCYRGDIHYDLVAVMVGTPLARGALCLHRARRSGPFSAEEATILEMIAPFIANHLEKVVTATVVSVLQTAERKGVIVCDTHGRVVYCNEIARDLCSPLGESGTSPQLVKEIGNQIASFVGHALSNPEILAHRCNVGVSSRQITLEGNEPGMLITLEARDETSQLWRKPLKERFALTDREIDVLNRAMAGGTNKEIAQALFIAEVTVKKHMQSIAAKVGARSRTAIAHTVRQEVGITP